MKMRLVLQKPMRKNGISSEIACKKTQARSQIHAQQSLRVPNTVDAALAAVMLCVVRTGYLQDTL